MRDIVERLRDYDIGNMEAADEVEWLLAENEKLRERLASVNDENQRIRQAIKEYLGNLARVTNDMLRETWEREVKDD